jgi:hypothetical protein
MTVKVYGASDDLVEIEGSEYKEDEIGCFEHDVRITFADGTVIRVGYPKDGMAVWWIKKEIQGPANQRLIICNDEDADIYSDIFYIESDVIAHWVIPKEET